MLEDPIVVADVGSEWKIVDNFSWRDCHIQRERRGVKSVCTVHKLFPDQSIFERPALLGLDQIQTASVQGSLPAIADASVPAMVVDEASSSVGAKAPAGSVHDAVPISAVVVPPAGSGAPEGIDMPEDDA
mmetsp:Transcript_91150/g.257465  ORF Transcript_91150/g.257465 Transcript_91150/m.257465 type:complete len:130 (-) Transcript_91150:83-472(-)